MRRRSFLKDVVVSVALAPFASKVGLAAVGLSSGKNGPPLQIGSEKQLFIDDSLVAHGRGVHLQLNRPVLTGERCIRAEKPWEGFAVLAYNSVMEDEGVLKMWYDAIANDGSRWCC